MTIQAGLLVRLILAIVIASLLASLIERLQSKAAVLRHQGGKVFGIDQQVIVSFVGAFVMTLIPFLPVLFAIKPQWMLGGKQNRENAGTLAPDLLRWLRVSWCGVLGAQLFFQVPFLELMKQFGIM
jgi:hypothetical protein